jgi:hypothetical protein
MADEDTQEATASDLIPVRVSVRQIDYVTTATNMLGQQVDVIKTAYGPGMPQNHPAGFPDLDPESQEYADKASDYERGELVELRPYQYDGLARTNSVTLVEFGDDGAEVEEDEELLDVNTATEEELADWIREEKPTVNDVVRASGGDPEVARKLLEAETLAKSPDEPRTGVVQGLTAVISRGGS